MSSLIYFHFCIWIKVGVHFRAKRAKHFNVICNVIGWSKKEALPLVEIDETVEIIFHAELFYDVIFSSGKKG